MDSIPLLAADKEASDGLWRRYYQRMVAELVWNEAQQWLHRAEAERAGAVGSGTFAAMKIREAERLEHHATGILDVVRKAGIELPHAAPKPRP